MVCWWKTKKQYKYYFENEKVNLRTKKLVKVIKGSRST